mmetsp:Transcript_65482/g.142114  ORF Transcript_65482/g.142114 Transcript_65482/m.142114 type:complete len:81 (+) Transcript_65482:522-764(+)
MTRQFCPRMKISQAPTTSRRSRQDGPAAEARWASTRSKANTKEADREEQRTAEVEIYRATKVGKQHPLHLKGINPVGDQR